MEEWAILAVAAVLIIVVVSYFAPRLGIAAPVLLVVIGIGCSLIPGAPRLLVEPEWILMIVLPPILYSAAVHVPVVDFRRNLPAIGGLSVLLVVVSAFGTGLLLWWLLPGLDFAAAVALGAVISPPDAVAATSIGKRLGLPPRLVTILEGEGLVNDATALVMLRSAVAAIAGSVSFWEVIGDFAFAATVGIAVGAVVGLVTVWARSRIRQPVLTTAISLVVPFLAFIPAEELHASGVLAVVVAGLITGHQSARRFSAQDRISERTNWRTIQLLLENGVFLLMGFELTAILDEVHDAGLSVLGAIGIGLIAVAALVVLRIVFVVPLIAGLRRAQRRAEARVPWVAEALRRLEARPPTTARGEQRHRRATRMLQRRHADDSFLVNEGLDWRGGAVIAWSGMRGVVTLAAAQSLPADVPFRAQLVLVAFTVAIVTLVAQGATLPLLIRLLGIRGTDRQAEQAELAALAAEIGDVARQALDNPALRRSDGRPFDPEAIADVRARSAALSDSLAEGVDLSEPGPLQQRRELRRILIDAEQAALLDARSEGVYSSRALARAQSLIDAEITRLEGYEPDGH